MDEILDLIDAADTLLDAADLADAGLNFADLAEALGIEGLDPSVLLDVAAPDLFGAADASDLASDGLSRFLGNVDFAPDVLPQSSGFSSSSDFWDLDMGDGGFNGLGDGSPDLAMTESFAPGVDDSPNAADLGAIAEGDPNNYAADPLSPHLDPTAQMEQLFPAERVESACQMAKASFPSELTEGLGPISYTHSPCPDGSGDFGTWDPSDGSIALYDHLEHLDHTLYHELGHHIVERTPELKAELTDALQGSGFAEENAWISMEYSPSERNSEYCAEAVYQFQLRPVLFEMRYPGASQVLRHWLGGTQ